MRGATPRGGGFDRTGIFEPVFLAVRKRKNYFTKPLHAKKKKLVRASLGKVGGTRTTKSHGD